MLVLEFWLCSLDTALDMENIEDSTPRRIRRQILNALDQDDLEWRDFARCKGTNPELFFPKSSSDDIAIALAKSICKECVVKAECLEDALVTNSEYGIRGGLDQDERRRYRRRRRESERRLRREQTTD